MTAIGDAADVEQRHKMGDSCRTPPVIARREAPWQSSGRNWIASLRSQ